jgi:hypothetical protein
MSVLNQKRNMMKFDDAPSPKMKQSLFWLLVQIESKIIKTMNFCLFTIACCSLRFHAFFDNSDSSTFLHIVLDVIQTFMIQIPHQTLSCFLFFFPFTHSHSFNSFYLVFFFFHSLSFIHLLVPFAIIKCIFNFLYVVVKINKLQTMSSMLLVNFGGWGFLWIQVWSFNVAFDFAGKS